MPALERDDVEASLRQKGFEQEENDHKFFKLMVGGQYTGIYTKTSRGKKYKTLGNDLVGKMARQLRLTTGQFVELVECSISYEQYVVLLRELGEEF